MDGQVRFVAKSPPGSGPVNYDPRGGKCIYCISKQLPVSHAENTTDNNGESCPGLKSLKAKPPIQLAEEDNGKGKQRPKKKDLGWEDVTAEDMILRYNWEKRFEAGSNWHSKTPHDDT